MFFLPSPFFKQVFFSGIRFFLYKTYFFQGARYFFLCSTFFFFFSLTDMARAGAWTQQAGKTQMISTVSHKQSFSNLNPYTEYKGQYHLSMLERTHYIETGLSSGITAIGKMTFRSFSLNDIFGYQEKRGLQSFEVGLKARLVRTRNFALSIQFLATSPEKNRYVPAYSDAYSGGEVRFLGGWSHKIFRTDVFFNMEFAEHWRQKAGNVQSFSMMIGFKSGKKWILLESQVYHQMEDPLRFETEIYQFGYSFVHQLSRHWHFQYGVKQAFYRRNLAPPFHTFSFSLWRRF